MISDTLGKVVLGALGTAVTGSLALGGAGSVEMLGVPVEQLETMTPGALTVDPAAMGTHPLGAHVVTVEDGVVSVSEGGDQVWSNAPGTAFLSAGTGDVGWQESRGYFWADVRHDQKWTSQQITAVESDPGTVTLRGDLHSDTGAVPFTVSFIERAEGGVSADVDTAAAAGGEQDTAVVQWTGGRSPGAAVHGFGEQFDDFNLDGRLIPVVAREQGVGRGEQPLTLLADVTNGGAGGTRSMTFASWPTYVTDDLQGVRVAPGDEAAHAFAIGDTRQPDRVGLEVWSPSMTLELTRGDTPTDLLTTQQGVVQRPRLAEWTQSGAIVGIQGGTDKVRETVDGLEASGTEVSGVWLQDWTGQRTTDFGDRLWWTWQLDEQRYPGWDQMVSDFRERGIRTTTYVNPWLVDAAPKNDPTIRNLWAEANNAGLLVTDPSGNPYMVDQGGFSAGLVDFTNPAGRDWMSTVIAEEVLASGVDGFMADFGEGLPMDAVLHEGDPELMHNAWPRLWSEVVRDGCAKAGRPDCVTWFRAGTSGMDSQSAAFWNGDQMVGWSQEDGLPSALEGTFAAGVSGWPIVHSDIGGYTSVNLQVTDYVRDREILARWGEYSAFGPMFRSHEGNRPSVNRQVYDDDEVAAFARNSRIFAALRPYRSQVLEQAAATGVPAVRHTWLNFPGTAAASNDRQFMLGDAVLMAPVMEPGATEVTVTLPPGTWRHLVTGETYTGGATLTVSAPIGTPAAFVDASHPMADQLVADVGAAARG
ncbi:MAG: alpha-glucosidase [Dietzia maris]